MPKNTKDAKDASKTARKATKKTKGTTHLVLLLDESGSMGGNVEAVVSGVNEFLGTFQDQDAKVTLATFDAMVGDQTRFKWRAVPVGKAKQITAADYSPRGGTPLYDAIADTITFVDEAKKKSEGVYMVILTDGMENASREHNAESITSLISRREKDGWGFLYLGANQDAQRVAAGIGLSKSGQASVFRSSARGTASGVSSSRLYAANYMASGSADEAVMANALLASETNASVEENVDAEEITRRTRRTLAGKKS